jgi:hypothetical protein
MSSESEIISQDLDYIIYYCILDQAHCGGQIIMLRNFAIQFQTP